MVLLLFDDKCFPNTGAVDRKRQVIALDGKGDGGIAREVLNRARGRGNLDRDVKISEFSRRVRGIELNGM